MESNIQSQQKELCQKIWLMANTLRGNIEAYEFKNYILGMIFYFFLSKRTEKYISNVLGKDNMKYEDAWKNETMQKPIIKTSLESLGFVIKPQYLFNSIVRKIEENSFTINLLQEAIDFLILSTVGEDSQESFIGLFSDMDLISQKLGSTEKERTIIISKIIMTINTINFDFDNTNIDVLGNTYEYLIEKFAQSAGKKAGEFYTPVGPSELISRIASLGLKNIRTASDPTCGSGSLLLRLKNHANVSLYFGQELTHTSYNLARMNMILRGIPYKNFKIFNGDTLEQDYFNDLKFHVQVANPPYSSSWSADNKFLLDKRFCQYGKLAPKSRADFAFIQHIIYHMDEDGRAVILLPHGVLFRKGVEAEARKYMIEELNIIDAVIGLPSNLFFGTGIPICILVLKKNRECKDNILFIDSSKYFKQGKKQNILRESDITKIVETYEKRINEKYYSHVASIDEVKENNYNLNIPQYIDLFEKEQEVDLKSVSTEIKKLRKEIRKTNLELKPFFDELGIDFPFDDED